MLFLQLKAVVIDENYVVQQEADVEFDVELPEFRLDFFCKRFHYLKPEISKTFQIYLLI